MFAWTIYKIFVLNRGWKSDCRQIMILVYVCSTFSVVELKTRLEKKKKKNDLNGGSLIHIFYLISLMACLSSQQTPNVKIMYFMFDWWIYILFVLNTGLETWFSPNVNIRKCLLDMKHSSTKNVFWGVNNNKWRIWCMFVLPFLFNNTYSLSVLTKDTKFPNQVFYVCLVDFQTILLNRGLKRDSFQIMILVHVYSNCSVVELKTQSESLKARNDANGVTLFHFLFNNF
jgi:hypothetical protein